MKEPAPTPSPTRAVVLEGERFEIVAGRPDIAAFWQKADAGRWEGDTFAFVRQHVGAQTTFVDVGAWIGPISLYASRHAGRVLALEPDPVAHGDLMLNVRANGAKVEILNVGIDTTEGELTLYAPTGLGQSTTSSFSTEGAAAITVKTMTFDQISDRLAATDEVAVKVDIEGHEYRMIDAIVAFARRHQAPLHISLHPRSFYTDSRRASDPFTARLATWRATGELVRKLAALGPVTMSASGAAFSRGLLFKFLFLRRLIKNFSLTVETGRINSI